MKTIRTGSGAGYSGDRIEPAVELAERGDIRYLGFECLAERTIALAQMEKRRDPSAGFDPLLRARMQAVPEQITLVEDNLSTRTVASLYLAYSAPEPPREAVRMALRSQTWKLASPTIPPDRRSATRRNTDFRNPPHPPPLGGRVTNTKGQVSMSEDVRCTPTVQFDRCFRRYICGLR